MAFFLEATFVGLFFFGWDKLSKVAHLRRRLAGRHRLELLRALDLDRQRLDAEPGGRRVQSDDHADGDDVVLRRAVQRGGAGEIRPYGQRRLCDRRRLRHGRLGLVFCSRIAIPNFARRSIAVAASFGLASALSVVILGDESGYSATHSQQMKLAAIEGMWDSEPAPASFTAFGFPDQEARETHFAVAYPLGHGSDRHPVARQPKIPGINELEQRAEARIRSGIIAWDALQTIRVDREATDPAIMTTFEDHSADLGFACCSCANVDDPRTATDEQITMAAEDTIPTVWPLFWAFRIMVGLGFAFIGDDGLLLLPRVVPEHGIPPLGAVGGGHRHSHALDRGRDGLVRGRVRPPALDGGLACCPPQCRSAT